MHPSGKRRGHLFSAEAAAARGARLGHTPAARMWFMDDDGDWVPMSRPMAEYILDRMGQGGAQTIECGDEGDTCFKEISTAYDEDLTDRTTCDCKNDCEMVHSFSTLQVRSLWQKF